MGSNKPTPNSNTGENVSDFGYKQEMARDLGWYTSFSVAFGFVSIATGIFTTYSSVLSTSGPRGIWSWAVVVAGQLGVALVFGALAARIPISGYSYQWISRLANPTLGWIMGWVSFTFLAVVVNAVDYTIASSILPVMFGYEGTVANTWLITSIVMLIQAGLVIASTKLTQRTNNIAVTIQLIGMITLTVLLFIVGFARGTFNWSNLWSAGAIPEEGYFSLGEVSHVSPWALAFMLGAFTIVGFESAANLAEETRDPARTVPKAMWQAVVSLGILGMLFLIAVTGNIQDIAATTASPTPVAQVIADTLGGFVAPILLGMVVISIFSCGLVILLSGTRLVWAMSRDERFPGWQALKKINPKTGTPMNSAIFMLVIGELILALFSLISTDSLFALFSAGTLLPAMIYAGTVVLYAVKRRKLPPSRGFVLGPWEVPVLIVSGVWLVYELLIFRDASFRDPWVYVVIMFAVGAAYFVYLRLTRGRDGLSMPEMTDIDKQLDAEDE